MSNTLSIPNKSHFNFDEVASITGVKKYVLRFWETEFDEIAPILSSSGQKLYQHSDIEAIARIKVLLFEKKYPIEKAKSVLLNGEEAPEPVQTPQKTVEKVAAVVEEKPVEQLEVKEEVKVNSENITLAKDKLNQIIDLASSLQEQYNWL